MRDRLVEQRQRIAHRAFGRPRDDAERFRLGLDAFLRRDIGEMRHQHVRLDPAQIEALAARQHRDRHFSDFGGGENELGVLRRLFQRFQKRVEGRGREHVDFVDDVDLVAGARWRVTHAVVDLAHVVDAGVGRRVHFQHVHVPAFHDRLAMHAQFRHMDGRALDRSIRQFVVQRARQNAGGRGFADAAHAGQDPGLRNSAGLERIGDGAHHRLLADQIFETRGAVFPRQHAIGLCSWPGGRRRDRSVIVGCEGSRVRQRHSSVGPQLMVSQGWLCGKSRIPGAHLAAKSRLAKNR